MINLIRNEVIKILHNKSIYFFLALAVPVIVLSALMASFEYDMSWEANNYEYMRSQLDSYDLTNDIDLAYYIEEKSKVDVYDIAKKYDSKSPEYYYAENEFLDIVMCMNEAEYKTKDEQAYNECKLVYDEKMEVLNNFDWKKIVNDKINEKKAEIELLELSKLEDKGNDQLIDNQIAYLNEEIKVYNYRLEHDIAPVNSDVSWALDDHLFNYQSYLSYDSNEENYTDKALLESKRMFESEYKTMSYLLDNDLYGKSEKEWVELNFASIFRGVDVLLLMVIIVIAAGIVADEFNKGTIKQLLLKPFKRRTILTSKIVATLIVFLGFTLVYSLLIILINSLICGNISSLFDSIIVYDFAKEAVVEYDVFSYCLINFIATLPYYIIIMFAVLFVGILTTNSSAGIMVGFGIYILPSLLGIFDKVEMFKILPMMHWNLWEYLFGGLPSFEYTSFGVGVFVVSASIIILTILSYMVFKYKDVKNQ